MTKFDDHLWSHLRAEHGADRVLPRQPGQAPKSRRPLIWSGAAGLAAVTAAAALTLTAASPATPAFAVIRHHDGSVTVTVSRASGIAGARRELARMGIRARTKAAGRVSLYAGESGTVIPGEKPGLHAMRADAARYAARGDKQAAHDLRAGARGIANGTIPDVVWNCTLSGSG